MFGDLFVTIAAGIISVMPVQPAPAIVVSATDIESSVVKYIDAYEDRSVTVDCSVEDLSVQQDTPQNFSCLTVDTENEQMFTTDVVVSAKDGKVSISAVVEKKSDQQSSDAKPLPEVSTNAQPVD